MNNSCRYPYEKLSIEDLEALEQQDRREKLSEVIPVLSKYEQKEKIIRFAALLVTFENIPRKTIIAIRSAAIPMIRNRLYCSDLTTIEAMVNVLSNLEEGKVFWVEELQRSLAEDKELMEIQTWLKYYEKLDKIAKVFQIQSTIESILEKAIKSDKDLDKIDFWLNNQKGFAEVYKTFDQKENLGNMLQRTIKNSLELNNLDFWQKYRFRINDLLLVFSFARKEVIKRAEGALENDRESKPISYWENNSCVKDKPSFISFLIDDLGLEKNLKEIIGNLLTKHTKSINFILKLAREDEIKEAVDKIVESEGYDFMQSCLTLAKNRNIPFSPEAYEKMADNLLALTNKQNNQNTRKKIIKIACSVYAGLAITHGRTSRSSILNVFQKTNYDKDDRAALKEASKIIGFKYKRQTWFDL